jgi:hypothetical protein
MNPWGDIKPQTKAERQAASARMPKCHCGNTPKLGTEYCSRCQPQEPDPQAVLLDATEKLLIGIGMGWDLDGLVEGARAACIGAGSTVITETFDDTDAKVEQAQDRYEIERGLLGVPDK